MTTSSEDADSSRKDFFFILPYGYATQATPEALERGLLEKIEFRQDDEYLSAVRLTFNNGQKSM